MASSQGYDTHTLRAGMACRRGAATARHRGVQDRAVADADSHCGYADRGQDPPYTSRTPPEPPGWPSPCCAAQISTLTRWPGRRRSVRGAWSTARTLPRLPRPSTTATSPQSRRGPWPVRGPKATATFSPGPSLSLSPTRSVSSVRPPGLTCPLLRWRPSSSGGQCLLRAYPKRFPTGCSAPWPTTPGSRDRLPTRSSSCWADPRSLRELGSRERCRLPPRYVIPRIAEGHGAGPVRLRKPIITRICVKPSQGSAAASARVR